MLSADILYILKKADFPVQPLIRLGRLEIVHIVF